MDRKNVLNAIDEDWTYLYTPPIQSLEAKMSFSSFLENIKEIGKRMEFGKKIDRSDYCFLDYFFERSYRLGPRIDPVLEQKIIQSIDADYSHYYFQRILNQTPEKYLYKIHGVPCRTYSKTQIEEALLGKSKLDDPLFSLALIDFCSQDPYFSFDFCLNEIKLTLNGLMDQKEELLDFRKKFIETEDAKKVSKIQNNAYQAPEKFVNESFKKLILESVPKEYSLLEKSIYLYLRLCQIFTYDEHYYVDSNGNMDHTSIERLKSIGVDQNRIVCYEFSYILYELLSEFDIPVHLNIGLVDNEFFEQHSNLSYCVDDLSIFADSTVSILEGDLIRAKLGEQVNGLRCTNYGKEKHEVFDKALDRVYKDLKSKFVQEEMDAIKVEYENLQNAKSLSVKEKVNFIFEKLEKKQLEPIDAIAYLNFLKNLVFTKEEQQNNFYQTVVYLPKYQFPLVILSVNSAHFAYSAPNTAYFLWHPKTGELIQTTAEEIQQHFSSNSISFIQGDDSFVPGVK